jgi:hydroxymethylpyrimidine kinase/phosphomethylpyrimidine kinase
MLMRMFVQIEQGSASAPDHGVDTRRRRNRHLPCALAVGGVDPGGGAGVLADLRAFERAGAFGCAAVALTTVQSTAGLRAVHVEPARRLVAELREVLEHQRVRAIKVGALGSLANVRAISRVLLAHPGIPVIVDTPMLPTRGRARLIDARALPEVMSSLFSLATLLTVNVAEARAFLGCHVRSLSDARDAARALAGRGARAVLVKGGHLRGPFATDVLLIDGDVVEIRATRLRGGPVHGTGCILASLVAGRLACILEEGLPDRGVLLSVVRWAKRIHHAALAGAVRVGRGMRVMVP